VVRWQKSSFSGPGDGNECVELAKKDALLLLRESEEPARVLAVSADALAGLLRYARVVVR
jgi:hypothetical protein